MMMKIKLKIFILLCRNPVTVKIKKKPMRVTPTLPQRVRQTKGRIPLTPYLSFFSRKNFSSFF
jgi:hypothetical protein